MYPDPKHVVHIRLILPIPEQWKHVIFRSPVPLHDQHLILLVPPQAIQDLPSKGLNVEFSGEIGGKLPRGVVFPVP